MVTTFEKKVLLGVRVKQSKRRRFCLEWLTLKVKGLPTCTL